LLTDDGRCTCDIKSRKKKKNKKKLPPLNEGILFCPQVVEK
jgi:hypothetical protein